MSRSEWSFGGAEFHNTELFRPNNLAGALAGTEAKLLQLVRLFVLTNYNKLGLSKAICRKQIERVLDARSCQCPPFRRHSCYLRNCWQTPAGLIEIIQRAFHLNCEGMADSLHHNPCFRRWCSEFPQDCWFGSEHDFFKAELEGENTFVNPPFNDTPGEPNILMKVIDRCLKVILSPLPTRIVLLLPIFEGDNGDRFLRRIMASDKATIVANFPARNFFFDPPDSYYLHTKSRLTFGHGVSLVLLCSKNSLVVDPIDWNLWKRSINDWANSNGLRFNIPRHPLDAFLSTGEPRAICQEDVNWWSFSRKVPLPPKNMDSRALRLWKLNRTLFVSGSLPKGLADSSRPEEDFWRAKFGLALVWGAWAMWERRNRLIYQREKRLTPSTCASPYHSLLPLAPNPWLCTCSQDNLARSYSAPDSCPAVPLVQLFSQQTPKKPQQQVPKKAETPRPKRMKRATPEVPLRRSERIRNRGIS